MDDLETFRAFVRDRSPALVRSAWLLTGGHAAAQDLVQDALVRTWQRWPDVRRKDDPEPYVRRVMMSIFLSWRRRRGGHEVLLADGVDRGSDIDDTGAVDLRHDVAAALARLPRGQRATLVLRYFDDLSEADTAAALGCAVGTVKSQAARALDRLRADPAILALLPEKGLTP